MAPKGFTAWPDAGPEAGRPVRLGEVREAVGGLMDEGDLFVRVVIPVEGGLDVAFDARPVEATPAAIGDFWHYVLLTAEVTPRELHASGALWQLEKIRDRALADARYDDGEIPF